MNTMFYKTSHIIIRNMGMYNIATYILKEFVKNR